MAQRGRGCLEIKESRNPFYTTTQSVIGRTASAMKDYDAPPVLRQMPRDDPVMQGIDWSFMYTRESDRIGVDIPKSDSRLSATVGRKDPAGDVARRRALGKSPVMFKNESEIDIPLRDDAGGFTPKVLPAGKEEREELVMAYKHVPKPENPLYTTNTNDIGLKRPTGTTFTFERRARQQGFSNSFNSLKYRDMGLNTSITRSMVHPALDPQFL